MKLIDQTRALDSWFTLLSGKYCKAGASAWLTQTELAQWLQEDAHEHEGKLLSEMDANERQDFDTSIASALGFFAWAKLFRTRGRQEYTKNLRLALHHQTPEYQLSKAGKTLCGIRLFWLHYCVFFVLLVASDTRHQIRRYWWVVGLAAAGSQLHRAFEFISISIHQIVGVMVGLLVGFLVRRLLDALR